MIDFRYHLVSIIAVFLALALGIVVGTTELNGAVLSNLHHQVDGLKADRHSLQNQTRDQQRMLSADQEFARDVAPAVVAGKLSGDPVVVVVLPGASGSMISDTESIVKSAGGSVSARVQLAAGYLDPRRASDLTHFATSGVLPAGFHLPASGDAGELAGELLSIALMSKAGEKEPTAAERDQLLAGFSTLSVLSVARGPVAPASRAVILDSGTQSGPNPGSAVKAATDLAAAFARRGTSVVVAGDAASAGQGGVVAAVRADDALTAEMSTVDNADTAAGQISTVLALAAGKPGRYGAARSAQAATPQLAK